jgi:3-oxoacyl-[acyl-carrier protein] reductase
VDLGLAGRTALVTGGRTGIGGAIAIRLAEEGCDVAIVDRTIDSATERTLTAIEAAGGRSLSIEADVASAAQADEAVARVVEELGRLDILVCSAGINRDRVIWKMSDEEWDEVIDVNLKGCFNFCRAAARLWRAGGIQQDGGGRIVNVASINGLRGRFGQTNYSASKGGLIALSKALAKELGRYGVGVNVIAPGMVTTDMTVGLPPSVLERAKEETVFGRLGTPEECADLAAFLCSERARHITGEVIRIDGGQYI